MVKAMNGLTKFGAFLGTLAFVVLAVAGWHQKVEVDYINSHQPPSLMVMQNSVVHIETLDGTVCSGWVLKGSNKVVTAAHCFEGSETNGPVNAQVTFNDGSSLVYQVTRMGDPSTVKQDFAELTPVGKAPPASVTGLPVCTSKPYYGEPIIAMGNPLDAKRVITFGHIANPNVQEDPATPPAELNGGMYIDITVFQGSSGGPVIDAQQGCVLGSVELIIPIHVQNIPIPIGINYANALPKDL
jgi:S1-C subfamily serine protease